MRYGFLSGLTLAALLLAEVPQARADHAVAVAAPTYGPAPAVGIVPSDLRWQQQELIRQRTFKQRRIQDAFRCAVRGTCGWERKRIVDQFRYDLASLNSWFRHANRALVANYKHRHVAYVSYPAGQAPPVVAPGLCSGKAGCGCHRCATVPPIIGRPSATCSPKGCGQRLPLDEGHYRGPARSYGEPSYVVPPLPPANVPRVPAPRFDAGPETIPPPVIDRPARFAPAAPGRMARFDWGRTLADYLRGI